MQSSKKNSFLMMAFMLSLLLIINSCGGKGGDTPLPPNACASKTITVTGTATNTTSGQSTGSISATGAGSTNFTYQLGNGTFQATGVFNGLAAGTYTITAKDADGCTGSKSFTVVDPCSIKNITITGTSVNAGPVQGVLNGTINAIGGGSTGFTYQINNGNFQGSGNFTGLAAGTYTITAKDADGCIKTQQFTIIFDPCTGKNLGVSATTTPSDKCSNSGSVTITGTGGSGFTYQLGTGAFQASNIFTNITVNTFAIAVKDADGCVKSGTVTVAALPAGALFTAVKAVIQTNCALSGCHLGAGAVAGLNFGDDCTIVGSWERIKARAVDAPTSMPPAPNPQLSGADKQKILDWIAAGHNNIN
jgi:hypothetical protein